MKLTQKVRLRGHKSYLLTGWVATQNVRVLEANGTIGANLCLFDRYEHSPSLVGTNDWTYLTLAFYLRNDSEVTVGARLGHNGSVVIGTAAFHDLCLIEVTD